jgi:hypothetical protein
MQGLAKVGDVVKRLGVPVPLDSGRFRSMTEDYPTPMARTAEALGGLPVVAMNQGVGETVAWLRDGTSPPVAAWLGSD